MYSYSNIPFPMIRMTGTSHREFSIYLHIWHMEFTIDHFSHAVHTVADIIAVTEIQSLSTKVKEVLIYVYDIIVPFVPE